MRPDFALRYLISSKSHNDDRGGFSRMQVGFKRWSTNATDDMITDFDSYWHSPRDAATSVRALDSGKLLDNVLNFRLAVIAARAKASISRAPPDFSKCASVSAQWMASPSAVDSRVSSILDGLDELSKKAAKNELQSPPDPVTLQIFEKWGSDALKQYAAAIKADIQTRKDTKSKIKQPGTMKRSRESAPPDPPLQQTNVLLSMMQRGTGGGGGGKGGRGGGGSLAAKAAPSAEAVQQVKDRMGEATGKRAQAQRDNRERDRAALPPTQAASPSGGLFDIFGAWGTR